MLKVGLEVVNSGTGQCTALGERKVEYSKALSELNHSTPGTGQRLTSIQAQLAHWNTAQANLPQMPTSIVSKKAVSSGADDINLAQIMTGNEASESRRPQNSFRGINQPFPKPSPAPIGPRTGGSFTFVGDTYMAKRSSMPGDAFKSTTPLLQEPRARIALILNKRRRLNTKQSIIPDVFEREVNKMEEARSAGYDSGRRFEFQVQGYQRLSLGEAQTLLESKVRKGGDVRTITEAVDRIQNGDAEATPDLMLKKYRGCSLQNCKDLVAGGEKRGEQGKVEILEMVVAEKENPDRMDEQK